MIIKFQTRSNGSYAQLTHYVLREQPKPEFQNRHIIFPWNLPGNSPEEWIQAFKENETHRLRERKGAVTLSHEVIAWHPNDSEHLTGDVLKSMAMKYIQLRGIQGQYLIASHFQDHIHLHVVCSGLEYGTGKSMRMSIEEFQDLKKEMQLFQEKEFPELVHSLADHGKKHREDLEASDKEYRMKVKHGTFKREELKTHLQDKLTQSTHLNGYLESLKSEGYTPYFRGGKLYGVEHEGRNFRFSTLGIDVQTLPIEVTPEDREAQRALELEAIRDNQEQEQAQDLQPPGR